MSPYREKQKREFLAKGFGGFVVVDSLTPYRGMGRNPYDVSEQFRKDYTIIVRPASSGRYGKSVVIRALLTSEVN
jgi:hypothetical protein